MAVVIDILLCIAVAVSLLAFGFFYSYKEWRYNPEFDDQMRCMSGIILCNKPLFGFLMHYVGGMVLLAAGLRVSHHDETSFFILAMLYASLSGLVNFDVRDFKTIHFTCLFCVLVFSVAFICMHGEYVTWVVYVTVSALFLFIILFNFMYTQWKWPWMDVQASVEIAWVLCLMVCIMLFCIPF